jgi:Fic family protein
MDTKGKSPGKWVKLPGGATAFVPNPAPETLPLDNLTVSALGEAERSLGQLTGILRTTGRSTNPHLVSAPLARREAIISSRIEGTLTTPEHLALLEAEAEHPLPNGEEERQTQEVLNYVRAIDHGFARLQEIPVCGRLIRELHAILLENVRGSDQQPGEFRSVQNFMGAVADIRQAKFVPPPPSEVVRCMDQLDRFMNSEDRQLPLLVRLGLAHYQFEAIHPFRDGNGRVGRIILPLLLCSYERIESPALYLSAHFERHKQEYTDRLLRVSVEADYLGFVRFFLEAVKASADDSVRRAEALLNLREGYRSQLQALRSGLPLSQLVDTLFEHPSLSIASAASVLGVSEVTAANHLRKLAELRVITEVTGRRRDQRYVAQEILRVAHEDL